MSAAVKGKPQLSEDVYVSAGVNIHLTHSHVKSDWLLVRVQEPRDAGIILLQTYQGAVSFILCLLYPCSSPFWEVFASFQEITFSSLDDSSRCAAFAGQKKDETFFSPSW